MLDILQVDLQICQVLMGSDEEQETKVPVQIKLWPSTRKMLRRIGVEKDITISELVESAVLEMYTEL